MSQPRVLGGEPYVCWRDRFVFPLRKPHFVAGSGFMAAGVQSCVFPLARDGRTSKSAKQWAAKFSPRRSLLRLQTLQPLGHQGHPSGCSDPKIRCLVCARLSRYEDSCPPAARHNGSWSSARSVLERHARQLSSDSHPTNDRRTRKDAVSRKGRRQPEVPATDATLKASLSKPADDIGAGFNTGTQCE